MHIYELLSAFLHAYVFMLFLVHEPTSSDHKFKIKNNLRCYTSTTVILLSDERRILIVRIMSDFLYRYFIYQLNFISNVNYNPIIYYFHI